MEEDFEEEACRVCRGEATEEEPLFHPCNCSGSIRYVHQACLIDWLSHSKKPYCELCNYDYQFTPIYKSDMPSSLPMSIIMLHLRNKLYTILKWTLRICLVAFLWLGLVPYITVWMWRFYFWNANTLFYYLNTWIVHSPKLDFYTHKDPRKGTSILYDCLEGWFIACVFTLTVIAGFLLREWILQNVPAELDDHEPLDEQIREPPERALVEEPLVDIPREEPVAVEPESSGTRRRRKRPNNRPLLAEEDYENLEAMWKSDTEELPARKSETAIIDSMSIESDSVFDDDDGYQRLLLEEAIPQEEIVPEVEAVPVVMDEEEVRGPEDINGILEAIGMKGSLYVLFQNSGLMILLMFLCLGGGVWIPYLLGAFFIALQPWRALVYVGRGVYDTIDLITDIISNGCVQLYHQLSMLKWPTSVLTSMQVISSFFDFLSMDNRRVPVMVDSPEIVMDPMTTQSYSLSLWHDVFSLWRYVRPLTEWTVQLYHDAPSGYRVVDRTLCITTGYVLLVIGGSLYLSRSRPIYANIGRTAQQILCQMGLFLKVSLFIWIEVVFFPIGCGLLLDLVALSMFYEMSGEAMHKRMLFLRENMASSIFIHWIVGTTCIFVLTSMVTFCRDHVRPGVFWFMRDPNNDPPVNPFKELVERSVTSQLRKTLGSALLYGFVIEFGIGGLIVIIGTLFEDIFPLKWSYSQPLITLPLDLLIVMFVIPYLIDYIHPKQVLRNLMVRWIQWLCHQLRLTSFLLGIRPREEEGVWTNNTFIRSGKLIKIPEQQERTFFEVSRLFTFLPKDIQVVVDDNEEQVIYIPPYFQFRMMLFYVFMWVFWSGLLCYLFVGPISIGRIILARYSQKRIHDIYSYFIGLSVLLSICICIKYIKNHHSFKLLQILNWIFNLIVIILCFGIVIPVLFGFLLQFYVIIPCQKWTEPPVIQLCQLWINGVVCFYLFQRLLPNQNQLKQAFIHLQQRGIRGFQIKKEMKELIGPVVLITMMANLLPFIIVKGIVNVKHQVYILQIIYPSFIGVPVVYFAVKVLIMMFKKWTQSIREDYYLIGRRLHNK